MKDVVAVFAIIAAIVALAVNYPRTFIPTAVIFGIFMYFVNRR